MPRKISQEFIIMDAFPLPVEGTETRVNAGAGANEFMVTFTETCERIGPWSCDGGTMAVRFGFLHMEVS